MSDTTNHEDANIPGQTDREQNNPSGTIIEPDWKHLAQMETLCRETQAFHHHHYPTIYGATDPAEDYQHYFGNYLPLSPPLIRLLHLKNPLRQRIGFSLGWESEGELQAYILYYISKSSGVMSAPDQWQVHINDIAVSNALRKHGIATKLLEALFKKTAHLKSCNYFANVYEQNPASTALFEKAGFATISRQYHLTDPDKT